LTKEGSLWYYKDRRINIYAAIDFAFSTKARADYTAIVVVGVDFENNIYVLDNSVLNKIEDFKIFLEEMNVKSKKSNKR
jgi:hypothetical protein